MDLESEAMRGLSFSLDFLFSPSKASAANIGIIAILVHFEKTLMKHEYPTFHMCLASAVIGSWSTVMTNIFSH